MPSYNSPKAGQNKTGTPQQNAPKGKITDIWLSTSNANSVLDKLRLLLRGVKTDSGPFDSTIIELGGFSTAGGDPVTANLNIEKLTYYIVFRYCFNKQKANRFEDWLTMANDLRKENYTKHLQSGTAYSTPGSNPAKFVKRLLKNGEEEVSAITSAAPLADANKTRTRYNMFGITLHRALENGGDPFFNTSNETTVPAEFYLLATIENKFLEDWCRDLTRYPHFPDRHLPKQSSVTKIKINLTFNNQWQHVLFHSPPSNEPVFHRRIRKAIIENINTSTNTLTIRAYFKSIRFFVADNSTVDYANGRKVNPIADDEGLLYIGSKSDNRVLKEIDPVVASQNPYFELDYIKGDWFYYEKYAISKQIYPPTGSMANAVDVLYADMISGQLNNQNDLSPLGIGLKDLLGCRIIAETNSQTGTNEFFVEYPDTASSSSGYTGGSGLTLGIGVDLGTSAISQSDLQALINSTTATWPNFTGTEKGAMLLSHLYATSNDSVRYKTGSSLATIWGRYRNVFDRLNFENSASGYKNFIYSAINIAKVYYFTLAYNSLKLHGLKAELNPIETFCLTALTYNNPDSIIGNESSNVRQLFVSAINKHDYNALVNAINKVSSDNLSKAKVLTTISNPKIKVYYTEFQYNSNL